MIANGLVRGALPALGQQKTPATIPHSHRRGKEFRHRSVCAAGQPAYLQMRRRIGLSASDRKFPPLTGRLGTQRARRLRSRTAVGSSAPWSSSPPSVLHITRVSRCVAHKFKARASFKFAGSCWWRSLGIDGRPRASRRYAPVVRRPGSQRCGAAGRSPVFRPGVSQRIALQNLPEVPGMTTSSKCSVILGSGGSASLRRSRGLSAGLTSSR